jgi:hypothetical protein
MTFSYLFFINFDPLYNCTTSEAGTATNAYTQSEDYGECTV